MATFSLGPLSLCLRCFLFDVTSATRCAEYEDCLVTAVEWTIIAITSDSWEQCDGFYVFHRQRDLDRMVMFFGLESWNHDSFNRARQRMTQPAPRDTCDVNCTVF